ncbi:hypothetical protein ACS0TY_006488 [Phlomoides rotata]
MEAKNMKMLTVAFMIVMLNGVAATADGPAPAPASDSSIFVPTFFASLAAMAFALLFSSK